MEQQQTQHDSNQQDQQTTSKLHWQCKFKAVSSPQCWTVFLSGLCHWAARSAVWAFHEVHWPSYLTYIKTIIQPTKLEQKFIKIHFLDHYLRNDSHEYYQSRKGSTFHQQHHCIGVKQFLVINDRWMAHFNKFWLRICYTCSQLMYSNYNSSTWPLSPQQCQNE